MIIISLVSCGQNSSEKSLNGRWYETENNGNSWMHFYPDSLIIKVDPFEKVEWKANNSKIEFDYPFLIRDSTGNLKRIPDKIIVHYKLSKNNDSLFGKLVNPFGEHQFGLLRANDYIEYLNKRYKIEFSLPQDNSIDIIKTDAIYGLKVFIGYSNNKVVGRTELSKNLNNLESDFKTFIDSIKPTYRPEIDMFKGVRFHLRVFADKTIADSTITNSLVGTIKDEISKTYDSFPKPPNDTLPIRIYRIYKSNEIESLGIMKGKRIKTIANITYN
ncbi:hypothetical protein [Flavivirga spongiicola]|uniref:Lipoprotein n=1 Tax=Flavivirga spongiicola TaxID=421621 RepID=A0ABU7XMV8_9FLAO|nr:hypothetical protein [Flavivirga sp. MEBiC05379]MDO5981758.1 hypothetical protein [Flavivirga sp. MEBiC05379]